MAYNSLKSYWIWRRKKEAEEKAWRELGVDKNIIAELRDFDRIAYNSDDRFYKRLNDVGDFYEEIFEDNSQSEITTVEQLLDEVENPEKVIQSCLDKLDIEYVDMMLLHHPDTNDVKAYKAVVITVLLHIFVSVQIFTVIPFSEKFTSFVTGLLCPFPIIRFHLTYPSLPKPTDKSLVFCQHLSFR